MKTNKGSTIGLVMILTFAVGVVAAGVTSLVNFQRNASVRRELHFQANNLAETALDYAFAFISNEVKRNGLDASTYVPSSGWKSFPLEDASHSFAKAFLVDSIPGPSDFSGATTQVKLSDIQVKIGAPVYADPIRYIVPTNDPVNRLRAYRGQRVYEQLIPVIARATATYGATNRKFTAYIRKNIALNEVPMFQKAITYQGQLHMHRSFSIIGGVHTNGNLALHVQGSDSSVYTGMVSCVGRFYRGSTFDEGGSGMTKYGYCPETPAGFLDTSAINLSSKGTKLKIIAADPNKTPFDTDTGYKLLPLDFDSRKSTWREDALRDFAGNLLDESHGVGELIPPGCTKYTLDIADPANPNKNEFNNGTYGLIEPCVQDKTNPAAKPGNIYKFERQARLVFRVECIFAYSGLAADPTTDDTTADCYKWIVKPYAKMVGAETDGSTSGDWTPLPLPPGVIGQTKVQTFPTAGDQYEIATCLATFDSNIKDYVAGSHTTRKLQGLFEVFRMGSGNVIATAASGFQTRDTGTSGTGNHYNLYDFDKIVYESSAATPADWTQGSGKVKAKIQTSTPRTTKDCGYDFDEQAPAQGFFNPRLGRGVAPITINMARLKEVIDGTDTSDEAAAFRTLLGVGGTDYNGVVYVEFPTSMRLRTTLSPRAYKDSATKTPYPNDMAAIDSYAFEIGSTDEIEKRHPDRVGETQDATTKGDREDKIIPIAKGLRGYPTSEADSEIIKAAWAIPALQIVNCRKLPKLANDTGLTISSNGPIYVVGSFNSDGNFATGTNITGTKPTDYATSDTGEISAGLFGETLTILSDTWGLPANKGSSPTYSSGTEATRFKNSFRGYSNDSTTYRKVTTGPVEISACIIAGEYPIFEFFFHALESWTNYYGALKNPICIKGAVVGMFHTEIQHFKKAYGRPEGGIVEDFWNDHGAFAIPAVRLHENLTKGIFPPGTPLARDYGQRTFTFLNPGSPVDKATLTAAGL